MSVYLVLAYLKYLCKVGLSLQRLLRLLQLNLFEKRGLAELMENRFTTQQHGNNNGPIGSSVILWDSSGVTH